MRVFHALYFPKSTLGSCFASASAWKDGCSGADILIE
jgi:hypothetical protein